MFSHYFCQFLSYVFWNSLISPVHILGESTVLSLWDILLHFGKCPLSQSLLLTDIKIQLTLEQCQFELHRSTSHYFSVNTYYGLRQSAVGWICRCRTAGSVGTVFRWDLSIFGFWHLWQILEPIPADIGRRLLY